MAGILRWSRAVPRQRRQHANMWVINKWHFWPSKKVFLVGVNTINNIYIYSSVLTFNHWLNWLFVIFKWDLSINGRRVTIGYNELYKHQYSYELWVRLNNYGISEYPPNGNVILNQKHQDCAVDIGTYVNSNPCINLYGLNILAVMLVTQQSKENHVRCFGPPIVWTMHSHAIVIYVICGMLSAV